MRFGRKIQLLLFAICLALIATVDYFADLGDNAVALVAGVGGFILVVILFTTIRGELDVRQRNDLFLDSIFENIPISVWVKDAESMQIERINRAAEELFGSREELTGKTAYDLFPKERAAAIFEQDRAVLRGLHVVDVVEQVPVRGGGTRWLRMKKIPLHDDAGRPAFLLAIAEDITEEKLASEDFRRVTREQLRALAARIESAREDEKTHISREIHDVLGQELTAIKLDAAWLLRRLNQPDNAVVEPQVAPQVTRLRSMLRQIDDTMGTVRRLASDLRPGALDELGLAAALAQHARDFQERSHIEVTFKASPEDDSGRDLDRPIATALFRIFQELLTNVARHSSAKHVCAKLTIGPGEISLSVRDDGIGISKERASSPSSLGLLGVRERAHLFGGEVEVAGTPGEGTDVQVRIPLSKLEVA